MAAQRSPNTLQALAREACLNIRDLHEETDIPERTFYSWAGGNGILPKEYRLQRAQIIGCDAQALAPRSQNGRAAATKERGMGMTTMQRGVTWGWERTMTDETKTWFDEQDGCFSFGGMKTTGMVLDGDGTEVSHPAHIRTSSDPVPATFFEEVVQAQEHIQREQEETQRTGESYQWNGEKYHLSKLVVSREPTQEHMTLSLWFKPRDHDVGLATRRCLDNPDFWANYLIENDWSTPLVGMSMSMGRDLTGISADGCALLTQRGHNQRVHQTLFHTSISEAVSPTFDRSPSSQAPDLYRCASRGLAEERGLRESLDCSLSDILLLGFSVDTHSALYG